MQKFGWMQSVCKGRRSGRWPGSVALGQLLAEAHARRHGRVRLVDDVPLAGHPVPVTLERLGQGLVVGTAYRSVHFGRLVAQEALHDVLGTLGLEYTGRS